MSYKARSLSGAQARVRRLMSIINQQNLLLNRFDRERKLLAKLAADTPQFYNPLEAAEAKQIRDTVLKFIT